MKENGEEERTALAKPPFRDPEGTEKRNVKKDLIKLPGTGAPDEGSTCQIT